MNSRKSISFTQVKITSLMQVASQKSQNNMQLNLKSLVCFLTKFTTYLHYHLKIHNILHSDIQFLLCKFLLEK